MNENKVNTPQEEEEKKKKKGLGAWWDALPRVAKIVGCSVAGVGVISAVVFPTLAVTVWNKGGSKPVDPLSTVEFTTCSWNDIAVRCNKLENNEITEDKFIQLFAFNGIPATSLDDFVGKERTVKVNNQEHKVRIIGTKHDKDENDKPLTLTFEFVNIISDSDGNSLAYQWLDTNESANQNQDYPNSSIRKALCGNGDFSGDILCAQKGETKWSDTYKNITIISMLPNDLQTVLKTAKKSVGTGTNYAKTDYLDKLFMPSTIELGYNDPNDGGFGSPYSYYKGLTGQTEAKRIKKQVNNSEVYMSTPLISKSIGQIYQGDDVKNHAGFNSVCDNTGGGYYWNCSPYLASWSQYMNSWSCAQTGYIYGGISVNKAALGVAPAFCI